MSAAACKVEIDGAALVQIGGAGQIDERLGAMLEQPGPKRSIELIARECARLNDMVGAFLLGPPAVDSEEEGD